MKLALSSSLRMPPDCVMLCVRQKARGIAMHLDAHDGEFRTVRLMLERVAGRHQLPPQRRSGYGDAAGMVESSPH